jgi:hypothetical protein
MAACVTRAMARGGGREAGRFAIDEFVRARDRSVSPVT